MSADLRRRADRIKNICRLINLAGVVKTLSNISQRSVADYEQITRFCFFVVVESHHLIQKYCRNNGTVEIAGRWIIKVYTSKDKFERFERIQGVYRLLSTKRVRHVDSPMHAFDTTLVLSPRGRDEVPMTEQELLNALKCVLEALQVSVMRI